jgi:hypothetical protein
MIAKSDFNNGSAPHQLINKGNASINGLRSNSLTVQLDLGPQIVYIVWKLWLRFLLHVSILSTTIPTIADSYRASGSAMAINRIIMNGFRTSNQSRFFIFAPSYDGTICDIADATHEWNHICVPFLVTKMGNSNIRAFVGFVLSTLGI